MDTKVTPTDNTDYSFHHRYSNHRTYSTNHMGFISYHITPLVINSLGAETHTHVFADRSNSIPPSELLSESDIEDSRYLTKLSDSDDESACSCMFLPPNNPHSNYVLRKILQ